MRRRRRYPAAPGGVIWQKTLDSEYHLTSTYTWRNVIPAADISGGASRIQVTFNAAPSGAQYIKNASIVERDPGTANGTEVPTELLFGGTSGVTIPAGETAVSDELDFTIDPNKDYLVILDLMDSGGVYSWIYYSGGETAYYMGSAYSALVKDMPVGYKTTENIIMSKIEAVG